MESQGTSQRFHGNTLGPSMLSLRQQLFPLLVAALVPGGLLGAATVLKSNSYVVFAPGVYLPIHALTEIASVVVSFSIFALYWNAADKMRDGRALIIGTAFLAVAILDVMHTLSFPGMPDFVTPSSTAKGIYYWISARMWAALALALPAFAGQFARSNFPCRWPLLALNLAVALAVFVAVSFLPNQLPAVYVDGQGLTPLKIGLEYLVAGISALAALAATRAYVNSRDPFLRLLAMALVVTVFSELSFTLYAAAYDTFNLLGHIYKVVAYYLIFQALFTSVVQRPYAELEKLYDEIDNQLQRTIAELRVRNDELEAFSYTVSHDLRAPLRSIDGFSQILEEDHGDELSDDGKKHLQIVRNSARRMNQLIEDLLSLSLVSRAELRLDPVNLGELARIVATELQVAYPERQVEFITIAEPTVEADARLLRIALENLLGNAWKFTSKRERARIEFGAMNLDAGPVFYVRDNGAGFDMTYASKLFGPFQRLHGENEFPGTGIGLATVQRIIRRHGGEVWAEGAANEGATFYFSLPAN